MKKRNFTKPSRTENISLSKREIQGRGCSRRAAFTLAEILITLTIVGVVAAMTIPTLIAKINSIVTDNQIKVFNAKLIKGMNLTKTAGDLNNTYESTYDFLVNGLGKNLKMAKVCDSSHIRDCIPYDKVKYDKNGTEEALDVKDLKTAGDLQINNTNGTRFTDTAAFVLADGTPVIVTYDLNCIDDPDKADTTINKCLAGIYDLNGTRKPNKYGESEINGKITHNSDLQPFNGARIANSALAVLGGVKIMTAGQIYDGIPVSTYCYWGNRWYLKPEYAKYGVTKCCSDCDSYSGGDRWLGAMKACQDQGYRLPTDEELAAMASELYGTTVSVTRTTYGTLDTSKLIRSVFYGMGYDFSLWSGSEDSDNYGCNRKFTNSYSYSGCHDSKRTDGTIKAICVAK